MDKEQNITITDEQIDELIRIGQQVRDFAAIQFEGNHLTIRESLAAIGAVAATFLLEFKEQCKNTTIDELKSTFLQIVDYCLDSGTENEK